MNEKILNFAKISTLAVLLAFGITQVSSWTAPTAVPPDGNVAAPINVGNATQTKAGNLTAGSLTSNGDIDVTGDNLINVSTPIAPADGVNKAYVDAQGGVMNSGKGNSDGAEFVWGYTDKHYFFTDTKYNGDLGGLTGADAKCNADVNAVSGKTYHAVRSSVHGITTHDSTFNAPGVGIYNNTYGWVNSILKYIHIGGVNYANFINDNPSGVGSQYFAFGSPKVITRASDVNVHIISDTPNFWLVGDAEAKSSEKCNDWTSSVGSGAYSRFVADEGIGHPPVYKGPYSCGSKLSLFCVED